MEILRLLTEKRMTAPQISLAIKGKEVTSWTYLYKHLRRFQELGLVKKSKQLWEIDEKVSEFIRQLFDPPKIKLYLAGMYRAVDVLETLEFRVPYLLSAGHYWQQTSGFKKPNNLKFASEIFVDSGAQQFYKKFKGFEYPYTTKEYLVFSSSVNANLVATLDLPLDILAPRGLDVKKGIEQTVNYGIRMLDEAEQTGAGYQVVPVLQGYDDPSQWMECLDLYKEHGIDSDIWGVGSLCMSKSSTFVSTVISEIRKELKKEKLHVFGLALNALKKVYKMIDSFDTSAWIYWAKMDGAVFVWDSIKLRFIQLQARDGKRYDTSSLMRVNLESLLEMVNTLNMRLKSNQE